MAHKAADEAAKRSARNFDWLTWTSWLHMALGWQAEPSGLSQLQARNLCDAAASAMSAMQDWTGRRWTCRPCWWTHPGEQQCVSAWAGCICSAYMALKREHRLHCGQVDQRVFLLHCSLTRFIGSNPLM